VVSSNEEQLVETKRKGEIVDSERKGVDLWESVYRYLARSRVSLVTGVTSRVSERDAWCSVPRARDRMLFQRIPFFANDRPKDVPGVSRDVTNGSKSGTF